MTDQYSQKLVLLLSPDQPMHMVYILQNQLLIKWQEMLEFTTAPDKLSITFPKSIDSLDMRYSIIPLHWQPEEVSYTSDLPPPPNNGSLSVFF